MTVALRGKNRNVAIVCIKTPILGHADFKLLAVIPMGTRRHDHVRRMLDLLRVIVLIAVAGQPLPIDLDIPLPKLRPNMQKPMCKITRIASPSSKDSTNIHTHPKHVRRLLLLDNLPIKHYNPPVYLPGEVLVNKSRTHSLYKIKYLSAGNGMHSHYFPEKLIQCDLDTLVILNR